MQHQIHSICFILQKTQQVCLQSQIYFNLNLKIIDYDVSMAFKTMDSFPQKYLQKGGEKRRNDAYGAFYSTAPFCTIQ